MIKVAFLGLGSMGALMAGRLLDAGYDLTVWNRSAERAAPLAEAGAKVAASPAEAVAGAAVVVTMLTDGAAVLSVLSEAAPALEPGAVVAEMSTIGPGAVAELRALLPAGVGLVDAPVRGSLPKAAAGTLGIGAGGSEADFAVCQPVLGVLGTASLIGPLGTGAAAKLVVNAVNIAAFTIAGEALALSTQLGMSQELAVETLKDTAVSFILPRVEARLANPEAPVDFALGLAAKDMRLATEVRDSAVLAATRDELAAREERGDGPKDFSSVVL